MNNRILVIIGLIGYSTLIGCTPVMEYATSKMTAIGEEVCKNNGGLKLVRGMPAGVLYPINPRGKFVTWPRHKQELNVYCTDGTYVKTPSVEASHYR